MGRQVKRVPLDFDFVGPNSPTWPGYLNQHYAASKKCPFCDGSGHNPETKKISDNWYDFDMTGARWCDKITNDEFDALITAGRLCRYDRETETWIPKTNSVDDVNACNSHNGSLIADLGHDAINRWICVETRARRLGVYGLCEHCHGDGDVWLTPGAKAASEAWEPTEPPVGDGYQMWETTSEGSPISPVFATPEELARWLVDNEASAFGSQTGSYEGWLRVCGGGFAPSAVMCGGMLASGVDGIAAVAP